MSGKNKLKRRYRKGLAKNCQVVLTHSAFKRVSLLSRGTGVSVKKLASASIMHTNWETEIEKLSHARKRIVQKILGQEKI